MFASTVTATERHLTVACAMSIPLGASALGCGAAWDMVRFPVDNCVVDNSGAVQFFHVSFSSFEIKKIFQTRRNCKKNITIKKIIDGV